MGVGGEVEGVGGGTISDSILGSTRHFFLLNLYNFKNIGGARSPCPPTPRSLNIVIFHTHRHLRFSGEV